MAYNRANRSPYSLTAFGFPLAGGFHRELPKQALNHRPALSVGAQTNYSSRSLRLDISCHIISRFLGLSSNVVLLRHGCGNPLGEVRHMVPKGSVERDCPDGCRC